ncbi:MAG: hypothetical protein S4CHLAM37_16550 [Chlamydiia bacterium]|nr:hypothetical protein [Chlamydiia bacterium]
MTRVMGMTMPTRNDFNVANARWAGGKAIDIAGKGLAGVAGASSAAMLATVHFGQDVVQEWVPAIGEGLYSYACQMTDETTGGHVFAAVGFVAAGWALCRGGHWLAGKVTGQVVTPPKKTD